MTPTTQHQDSPNDRATWDRLSAQPGGHILQSWGWGELKAAFGWRTHRLSVGTAAAQVLFRPLPAGLGTLAYVPKGPLWDMNDTQACQALLEAIHSLARRQRAICLKIEPHLEDSPALHSRLRKLGFLPSVQDVQPRRTILVDLIAPPDDLLRRMKQKTRYNIRLAGRKGITVRAGDKSDLPAFYGLMEATAERDEFAIHSADYYEAAHHLFVPHNQGQLLLAEHKGQLLAGLVVMGMGATACYMYGASSNEKRHLMPTYALQWQAMLWAKEQGCQTYDLWGVPDAEEETLETQFTTRSDGLWGVYRFKRGFGGQIVRTVGAWDLVYAPIRYRLYQLTVTLRARGQSLA